MRKSLAKVRKNKKGFSLVELIVVIAIMAVLVAILAPQFIKYVEKSRQSADVKNSQEMVSAVQAYAADTGLTASDTTGTVITIAKSGTSVAGGSNAAAITTALSDAGVNNGKLKSSQWGADSVTITVKTDGNGNPTFEYAPTKFSSSATGTTAAASSSSGK